MIARSRDQRTVIARAITFDGEQFLSAFFDNDVDPKDANTAPAFDFVTFILQKFDDLFFERGIAENNIVYAVAFLLESFVSDTKRTGLFNIFQICNECFQTFKPIAWGI
jgi:hypothetical protein